MLVKVTARPDVMRGGTQESCAKAVAETIRGTTKISWVELRTRLERVRPFGDWRPPRKQRQPNVQKNRDDEASSAASTIELKVWGGVARFRHRYLRLFNES
jgi:hypothetical protein